MKRLAWEIDSRKQLRSNTFPISGATPSRGRFAFGFCRFLHGVGPGENNLIFIIRYIKVICKLIYHIIASIYGGLGPENAA